MGKRNSVLSALVWTILKTPHPVDQDGKQRLVGDPIDADLLDGSVLEQHRRVIGRLAVSVLPYVADVRLGAKPTDLVQVAGSALSRLVKHLYAQLVVRGISGNDMVI